MPVAYVYRDVSEPRTLRELGGFTGPLGAPIRNLNLYELGRAPIYGPGYEVPRKVGPPNRGPEGGSQEGPRAQILSQAAKVLQHSPQEVSRDLKLGEIPIFWNPRKRDFLDVQSLGGLRHQDRLGTC